MDYIDIDKYATILNYIPEVLERYLNYTGYHFISLDKIKIKTKEDKLLTYCIGIVLESLSTMVLAPIANHRLRTLKKRFNKHKWGYIFNRFCTSNEQILSTYDKILFDDLLADLHLLSDRYNEEKGTHFTLEDIYDAWQL